MIYVFFRITAFFLAAGIIFPNGTPKLFKICFSLLLSAMIAINLDINVTIKNFYELIIYGTMSNTVIFFLSNLIYPKFLKLINSLDNDGLGIANNAAISSLVFFNIIELLFCSFTSFKI